MSVAIDPTSAERRSGAAAPLATSRVKAAAWLTIAVCGAGVAASAFLTVLKHLSDYACGHAYLTACTTGETVSCERVLSSAWSHTWGVPTSAFATCFYLSALIPSVRLLRGRAFTMMAWRALALMAAASIGTSIVMATYAGVVVGAFCTYCAFLYATSVAFGAAVLWARPEGKPRPVPWTERLLLGLSIAAAFLVSLSAQAVALDKLRDSPDMITGCYRSIEAPPGTIVREGPASASLVVAEVIDPSCPHCRDSFRKLKSLSIDPRWEGKLATWVFLFPRDGRERCLAGTSSKVLRVAKDNQACQGALAVQCAEQLRPGAGMPMLEKLFELQDAAPPWFDRVKIEAKAASLGLDTARLLTCMEQDAVAAATVRGHVRWGVSEGVRETPRLVIGRAPGGVLDVSRVAVAEGDKSASLIARLLDSFNVSEVNHESR